MYSLSSSQGSGCGIHVVANLLHPRKDLHALFNEKYWTFLPRGGRAVVTLRYSKDSLRLYHGRAARPLQVNAPYVYARFAWSAFPLPSPFSARHGWAIEIWDESTCELKLRPEPEKPPSQRPKRKAVTKGGPSVRKTSGLFTFIGRSWLVLWPRQPIPRQVLPDFQREIKG